MNSNELDTYIRSKNIGMNDGSFDIRKVFVVLQSLH